MTVVFQSLETAVTDHGRSYADRVAALLSAWEKLAGMTARASPDAILSLAQHIYRWASATLLICPLLLTIVVLSMYRHLRLLVIVCYNFA